jgi:hypothetical protein
MANRPVRAGRDDRGAALRRLHRGLRRLRSRETSWASTPARRCRPGRRPAASRASVCCQRTAMQPEHGGPGGQTSTAASTSCPHSATRRPVCPVSLSASLTRCSRPSPAQVTRSARVPTLPVTPVMRPRPPGPCGVGLGGCEAWKPSRSPRAPSDGDGEPPGRGDTSEGPPGANPVLALRERR